MGTAAKIAGWTIGGAILVKLLTTATTGTVITNLGTAWANIISAVTGGAKG